MGKLDGGGAGAWDSGEGPSLPPSLPSLAGCLLPFLLPRLFPPRFCFLGTLVKGLRGAEGSRDIGLTEPVSLSLSLGKEPRTKTGTLRVRGERSRQDSIWVPWRVQ